MGNKLTPKDWMMEADSASEELWGINAWDLNGGEMVDFDVMQTEDPWEWAERLGAKYDLSDIRGMW